MISTFHQVREMLERRLQDAGLTQFIVRERSQYLDLDGEVFAEIVVNDGTVLEQVERGVQSAAEEARTQGVLLDTVVRALWEILSLNYAGTSRTTDLSQWRAGEEFQVALRSGKAHCSVTVHVTWAALELLDHKLGVKDADAQNALPAGYVVQEMVAPIARRFIEQALSRGGTSYWDPLQSPVLELTATDMSFLMGQSTAFEELRQAISDAFEPPVLESFLGDLVSSGTYFRDFDAVLPSLSTMLGGAYKGGETFSTSTTEIYRRLDRTEQELLRKYFQGKVEQLRTDPRHAHILQKYPKLFSNP